MPAGIIMPGVMGVIHMGIVPGSIPGGNGIPGIHIIPGITPSWLSDFFFFFFFDFFLRR